MDFIIHQGRPENGQDRSDVEMHTYDLLDELGIPYERIDHEAVETMEACKEIDKALEPAVVCKNLFLVNSSKTQYYLLMLCGEKRFKSGVVSRQIGSTRLSFASPEKMQEFLKIKPGSVSVMGLMNDVDHQIELLVDEDAFDKEYIGCHPCVNTSSLRMKTKDVFGAFLERTGHSFQKVKVE